MALYFARKIQFKKIYHFNDRNKTKLELIAHTSFANSFFSILFRSRFYLFDMLILTYSEFNMIFHLNTWITAKTIVSVCALKKSFNFFAAFEIDADIPFNTIHSQYILPGQTKEMSNMYRIWQSAKLRQWIKKGIILLAAAWLFFVFF